MTFENVIILLDAEMISLEHQAYDLQSWEEDLFLEQII